MVAPPLPPQAWELEVPVDHMVHDDEEGIIEGSSEGQVGDINGTSWACPTRVGVSVAASSANLQRPRWEILATAASATAGCPGGGQEKVSEL